jgi:hypothetical protein
LLGALVGTQLGLEVHVLARTQTGPTPELVRARGATYYSCSVAEVGFKPDVIMRHWYKAGEALARADHAWLSRLITRCERPEDFAKALERRSEDIKAVIQFAEV